MIANIKKFLEENENTLFDLKLDAEGVETPVRTSYSTEMDASMLGQLVTISSLATYKQWKLDNNKGNESTWKDNEAEFSKLYPETAVFINQMPASKEKKK